MTPERYKIVSHQIEFICGKGCEQVSDLLGKAENGNAMSELSAFSHSEVSVILTELTEIMAVYDNK